MTMREELQQHAKTLNLLAVVADDCQEADLFQANNAAQEYFQAKMQALIAKLQLISMRADWKHAEKKE